MALLYVDNFRGFKDTYIPLKNVNFFIGENSTGKTSVLKLIKILSDPRFWFLENFSSDDAELGYFSEIVSRGKTFFRIGLLSDLSSPTQTDFTAILLKFGEEEFSPVVKEVRTIFKNKDMSISRKANKIIIRKQGITQDDISQDKVASFRNWIHSPLPPLDVERLEDDKLSTEPLIFHLQRIINEETKTIKLSKKTLLRFSLPTFLEDVTWIAPIRAKPERTYDNFNIKYSAEGAHVPYLLRRLLTYSKEKYRTVKMLDILNKYGLNSRLFEDVKIKKLGKEKAAPFELHIILKGISHKILNVGYGVSQILPILIEILSRPRKSWFAIQQPEIHLHPRAQAAFGEFLFDVHKLDDKNFIVETHSDFLIDRFRYLLYNSKKTELAKDKTVEAQVLFFEKTTDGNFCHQIVIEKDGNYSTNQPKSFKEFFIQEELNLIKI